MEGHFRRYALAESTAWYYWSATLLIYATHIASGVYSKDLEIIN